MYSVGEEGKAKNSDTKFLLPSSVTFSRNRLRTHPEAERTRNDSATLVPSAWVRVLTQSSQSVWLVANVFF